MATSSFMLLQIKKVSRGSEFSWKIQQYFTINTEGHTEQGSALDIYILSEFIVNGLMQLDLSINIFLQTIESHIKNRNTIEKNLCKKYSGKKKPNPGCKEIISGFCTQTRWETAAQRADMLQPALVNPSWRLLFCFGHDNI